MLTAKIFIRLFLALYLVIAGLLLVTYFTTPFYGDLTRMGLLPETMFGWRQPQPNVSATLLKSVKAVDADVVVIGDSFSAGMVWQSQLVNKGLAVKTLHWTDFGAVCANVEHWLKQSGFHDKGVVIIESIQSKLDERLDDSLTCRDVTQPVVDVERLVGSPRTLPVLGTNARNGTEKILTGVAQLWNARLVRTTDGPRLFGSEKRYDVPVVRPVAQGCEWFSHAYCNKVLFNLKDDRRAPLSDATLANIKKINTKLAGYKVVWLVVPDKTTIYFEKESAFWRQLQDNGLGPDLYDPFLLARDKNKDLYMPNDTHLSTTGFLMLGKIVGDYIAVGPEMLGSNAGQ